MRLFQEGFNFSQDGPGNRLVLHLQGCNLRCPWCSNPEGLAREGGYERSVDALLDEALRSRLLFFAGGGITLTGGEVTLQLDEVKQLLACLRENAIHTCIETNGISPRLPELFPALDLLILDVKHHDPLKHAAVTGASCAQTHRNLTAAIAAGQPLALRIPLIGGFNASKHDAKQFAALFAALGVGRDTTVELLPYHEYGRDKYARLGIPYLMDSSARVSAQTVAEMTQILREAGLTLIHT